ncbi:MAG: Y-family DNA polymerase [Segetibacter sp.]|nr:Y-family DNA polymerase [Segetibacter sp.]
MKAIIDCNSFYCSCERLFRPELKNKPVVVLSNNDGCIISISDEAKKLGIKMATPYFMGKPVIEDNNVAVFSSNYNLYGELSQRVMDTVRTLLPDDSVEVYSVDEAFLDLSHVAPEELNNTAVNIRKRVEQWTGISVSVGVAPTKTLAKVANHIAKKNKEKTGCVMILDTPEKIADALNKTKVGDVWGVGSRKALKLENIGIEDAWQLKQMPEEWARQHLGGVVGVRLIKELRGVPAIELEEQLMNKKMITTTRMFGTQITEMKDIKEAVATYVSRAAEKLRRQQSAAKVLTVYVVPKEDSPTAKYRHGPTQTDHIILPAATSATNDLIKPAMHLVERLFNKGNIYKKAGVILSGLEPDKSIQSNLFVPKAGNEQRYLMDMIDNVNFSMRDDILKFASSGTEKNWKMRQDLRSPRYTTRWKELREVK